MECRRVHDDRPRASTSGGQSADMVGIEAVVAVALPCWGFFPARAKSDATSLHVRHLTHNETMSHARFGAPLRWLLTVCRQDRAQCLWRALAAPVPLLLASRWCPATQVPCFALSAQDVCSRVMRDPALPPAGANDFSAAPAVHHRPCPGLGSTRAG